MEKYSILLIEEDDLDIISFQRSLKQLGIAYDLYIAANVKEAFAMLKMNHPVLIPDLIFLDLNAPGMNSIEFLKELKADEKLKKTKVFVITTSTEGSDRAITNQLGISGYFIKPLNYSDNTKRSDSMEAFVQFYLRKILTEENDKVI